MTCVQEAEADNQVKCEAVCAVGRLIAFQSVAAGDWLAPQLISHMVGHGKQVNPLLCTNVQDLSICCCLGPASGSSCGCTPALLLLCYMVSHCAVWQDAACTSSWCVLWRVVKYNQSLSCSVAII